MKKILFMVLLIVVGLGLNFGITVGGDIELSSNRQSLSTSQFMNLIIKTDENYIGKLFFSVKYKNASATSWTSISSLTSSSYFSDYSTVWSNGYYRMTSSDDGEAVLKNLVKFKKKGYYKIYVKDVNGDYGYIQFSVGQNESNSDLKISVSPSNPNINERIKLIIETDEDYVGRIDFTKLQYRSNGSDSWSNIPKTSNTYVSDYSTVWSNGYYRMTSSDDGEKILKNLVKFKKKGYYRIYVKDTKGNQNYIQFSVGTQSSYDDSVVDGFTNSELVKINQTYKNWNSMIAQMQRQYPHLKKNIYWQNLSSNFYDDMKDVVSNKRVRDFDDYYDFRGAFSDWYEYTMKNI